MADTVRIGSANTGSSFLKANVVDYRLGAEAALDQVNRTIEDLAEIVPNLEYSLFPSWFTIRGVGRTIKQLGSDPGVATYVDTTYTSETSSVAIHPLFLERTEILRGPQGTLYGSGSLSGTPHHLPPAVHATDVVFGAKSAANL